MNQTTNTTPIALTSGSQCVLHKIKTELIPNYYVLAFPKHQGEPSVADVTEMLALGTHYAAALAQDVLDDAQAFTLLYSGYSARREKGWHVHIILLGNRWRKAWLYFALAGKNVLQALRWRKDDSVRQSHGH
ncbi:hypothetical protein R50072_37660 [Simiduia litorea]|uniref:hypothetical protein n=1 Tax=Simiduia litorea TaxID=1435348 RepID=UPI0036F3C325